MDTKGGRYTLTMNGQTYSGRAKANIMPARATLDAGVNQDGTGYATVSPQLTEIELSFDRGSRFWVEREILRSVNVTFVEIDVANGRETSGVTHFLTGANIVGRPSLDTASGEISGMKLASDRYKVTRG